MKFKSLLPVIFSFYCFNAVAQDDLKSPQRNDGNVNFTAGGCDLYNVYLTCNILLADSFIVNSPYNTDTIYISGNDSIILDASWDYFNCGPLEHVIWFKDNIMIDSVSFPLYFNTHAYKTVQASGEYDALLFRYVNGIHQISTPNIRIINTNSTTSINTQNNSHVNIAISNNKIIVKNLHEKNYMMLSLYDLTGRIIFNKEIIPSALFEIEIPSLSNGMYVLNLKNKNLNVLRKFNVHAVK